MHIIVDEAGKRRGSPDYSYHVCTQNFARGSFVSIGHDTFVASPALCFLQASVSLPTFELVELGYELCGYYSRTPGIGDAKIDRVNKLVTARDIGTFAARSKGMRGQAAALRASRYIMDNSKSPTETDMAVKLVLPPRDGGYGFPLGELNSEVPLTPEAAVIAHRQKVYPDLMWGDKKLCLEYDSSLHHESKSDRTRDSLKRNALGCMGYKVITVTPSQLQSVDEFHGIATEAANRLGIRLRFTGKNPLQKRFELNEAIKRRIRVDLTPTIWPYF